MTATPARIPTPGSSSALATLPPAYFAMVMATGIVSIACHLLGYEILALLLFALNGACYLTLWLVMLGRAVLHREAMLADILSHARGVGFFTWVAATCVLATQCVIVYPLPTLAMVLGIFGAALWVVILYGIFTALTILQKKPDLSKGLNGGWLVAVVATQSLAIISARLANQFHMPEVPLFIALNLWLAGGMLYIWLISLIFYRYMFFVMDPADLAPPYWINMGAMAISTLAGALLILAAPEMELLTALLPFLKGMTLLFWATATGWVPMLLILGVWRHVYRRFPLRYDPLYWGAVFPLGMYTACTWQLARAIGLPFLEAIPRMFIFIALAAWLLTFIGMLRDIVRILGNVVVVTPAEGQKE